MTVTEGAEKINRVADEWTIGRSEESIYTVTRRVARKLSDNPIFNLAAYMKYLFGSCLSGETDDDWLVSAEEANKILSCQSFNSAASYYCSPSWKE